MRINPKDKMIKNDRMEKWVLRKAFESYLPNEVAWRQKEQFSDGVGYDWIDTLKTVAEARVTDDQFENSYSVFKLLTFISNSCVCSDNKNLYALTFFLLF